MANDETVDSDVEEKVQAGQPLGVGDVEPEPAAEPGDRDNPLTLEEVHREAFLNRERSAFGNDPTVATPGEDAEPQAVGVGDPDHVITLAKYGRQADVGEDAEDTSGVAGGGLVAVDRETGEPIEGGTRLVPAQNEIETNEYDQVLPPGGEDEDDDSDEDLSKLTVAELKERAVAKGYDESDVKSLKKDELLGLDLA
jgi:hypothetical protein